MKEIVNNAFKKFSAVQSKLAEYGAADSEPDGVMQGYLMSALGFRNRPARLPVSGDDWQLYTSTMACGKAARSLTAALKRLEKELRKLCSDPGMKEDIQDCFWRCY